MIGIDPSLRHTGLCFLQGAEAIFYEIKTEGLDVLSATRKIKKEFLLFWAEEAALSDVCIEKQLSVGGQSSALMFYVQMAILEVIAENGPTRAVLMPMPIQLQSYVKKRHACPSPEGRALVKHFQETCNHPKRISQHCVDAYYLARLGQDVLAGVWRYNLPSNEQPLTPWKTVNGDEHRCNQSST